MTTIRAAFYARVSSEQQAAAHTIESQVSALSERARSDGTPVKGHTDGMLKIGHATHVAGGIPGIGALVGVFLQFPEVRRQELVLVAHNCEINPVGDKGGGIAEQVDILMHLLHHFKRQLAR